MNFVYDKLPAYVLEEMRSVYPYVLQIGREQAIACFLETAANRTDIWQPEQLLKAVKVSLRNAAILAPTIEERNRYEQAAIVVNWFPLSGKRYAERALMLLSESREAL